jgi:hypothetical protein
MIQDSGRNPKKHNADQNFGICRFFLCSVFCNEFVFSPAKNKRIRLLYVVRQVLYHRSFRIPGF